MSLLGALRLDLAIAWRHLTLDLLAGSGLVPRPLRWALYRALGLDVRTLNVFSGARITGRDLHVGRGTFINHACYLDVARGRIEIGERCQLGPEVMVLTATHDVLDDGSTSAAASYRTTTIGDRVWIGARATVLPGARIGDGCVVAAGAVVSGDLPAGGVYGGVPARRLREAAEAPVGAR